MVTIFGLETMFRLGKLLCLIKQVEKSTFQKSVRLKLANRPQHDDNKYIAV